MASGAPDNFEAPSPWIIGIHGRKKSGKDTVAGFIEEWAQERQLSTHRNWYAWRMKQSGAALLKMSMDDVDNFKLHGRVIIELPDENGDLKTWVITGREFWQRYGTESHRDIFGFDFWVDQLLPLDADWWAEFNHADVCVVADVRFENEVLRIKKLGGEVWKVNRPGVEPDDHSSENLLPDAMMDWVVDNDSDLADLQAKVRYMLGS